MRLTDTRTGSAAEIRPAHHGLLRVAVHLGHPGRPFDLSDLRALLTADVLRRAGELGGRLQVSLAWAHPALPPGQVAELARQADLLGVHPPDTDHPAGPADVHLLAPGTDAGRPATGAVVAATTPARPPVTGEPPLGFLEHGGAEPLAVRLALLRHSYRAPVDLTRRTLTDAQETLDRWRRLVAYWAQEPSLPVLADPLRRSLAAVGDDLDTATVLAELDALADGPDPAGAGFETSVRLDRILGLELPRDIGRSAPRPVG
ncbi:hypothetical protein OH807_38965 [Kitasatospora sp. NBC_01560]|uniref:hypothetical protein n=1 Tax=Kitasatospora sp. NBC_01560 TaxID=2975965 RepID=UPI00386BFF8E